MKPRGFKYIDSLLLGIVFMVGIFFCNFTYEFFQRPVPVIFLARSVQFHIDFHSWEAQMFKGNALAQMYVMCHTRKGEFVITLPDYLYGLPYWDGEGSQGLLMAFLLQFNFVVV